MIQFSFQEFAPKMSFKDTLRAFLRGGCSQIIAF